MLWLLALATTFIKLETEERENSIRGLGYRDFWALGGSKSEFYASHQLHFSRDFPEPHKYPQLFSTRFWFCNTSFVLKCFNVQLKAKTKRSSLRLFGLIGQSSSEATEAAHKGWAGPREGTEERRLIQSDFALLWKWLQTIRGYKINTQRCENFNENETLQRWVHLGKYTYRCALGIQNGINKSGSL